MRGDLPSFEEARERLRALLLRDSVRTGEFTLASGRKSDFFVDCKPVALSAEGHLLLGTVLGALAGRFAPIYGYAAVPLGGCALASAASFASALRGEPLPAVFVRKEAKDHGTGRRVEGAGGLPGRRLAILEDVVTTGGSTLRAADGLRAHDLEPAGAVCIVDREEGGGEALRAAGIPLLALFTRTELVGARAAGRGDAAS
jgi:orotate phosphoribosyltransferase